MQREFARRCRAIKDTMPIPLGQGGTPTSAHITMALLQYWEEAAEGIGPFGGPCRPDSALMLFVLSQINHLLDPGCEITRIEVRSFTDWDRFAQEELSAEERSVMREEYCHNKANQKHLRRDIRVAYTEEAFVEQVDLEKFHGDFYLFPMPWLDPLSHPGCITLSTPYIAPRANGRALQKPEAARMQREFARRCLPSKTPCPSLWDKVVLRLPPNSRS